MSEHHQLQYRPFVKLRSKDGGPESVHYSVVYEGFPDEFRQLAERELNETEENRRRGLQKLKDYMKREQTVILEDYYLLAVLRSCKYNLKKCESKLKTFLTKRREIAEMLSAIDSEKIGHIIDDFGVGILPYRDKRGCGILYTRPYGMLVDRYEVHDIGVVIAAAALFLLKFPISSVTGFAYFGECKSPNLYIFYPILRTFKEIMFYLFSFPMRISSVEILNENYLVRCFYKVISPILSKKLLGRISLHGLGYDNLHKLYDPNILPEEFGGNLGPLNNVVFKQKLIDFIEDLKNEGCTVGTATY